MGKRVVWWLPLCLGLGCAAVQVSPPASEIQLAAQCLEKGDESGALPHLGAYVEANPEQVSIRAHLAELELKLGHAAEAKKQFERYVRDAQVQGGEAGQHLIAAHTRLAELAGDEYGEHLNRGIRL